MPQRLIISYMPSSGGFLPHEVVEAKEGRFLDLLDDVLSRIPAETPPLRTVTAVRLLRSGPMEGLAGLTHWKFEEERSEKVGLGSAHRGLQTITFYSGLLDQLSDRAYFGVIAHELAHAWLNEHLIPEESAERESKADELARKWGFREELAALEAETEPF